PAGQLGGMLLHEVHHVVFEHLFIRREDYQDEWALIVATEVSVNEFIREPLPPGVITLSMFPDLPPMESWSERYQRLRKVKKEDRLPLSAPLDNHDLWGKAGNPQEARRMLADLLHEAAMEAG